MKTKTLLTSSSMELISEMRLKPFLTKTGYHYFEERELTIGKINNEIVIIVVHTDRDDVVRIISARKANKRERRLYHG